MWMDFVPRGVNFEVVRKKARRIDFPDLGVWE